MPAAGQGCVGLGGEHLRRTTPNVLLFLPAGLVTRVRIALMAADGLSNNNIGEKLGVSAWTVSKWRARYLALGLPGLHDALRPGRPRAISDDRVATLVRRTLQTRPKRATHWSVRSMAGESDLSVATVYRIWRAFGLQPHRRRYFKLSNDPLLWKRSGRLSDCT
jgi:transposase